MEHGKVVEIVKVGTFTFLDGQEVSQVSLEKRRKLKCFNDRSLIKKLKLLKIQLLKK